MTTGERGSGNSESITDLQGMTVSELKSLASEMGVNLISGMRKSELIDQIRSVSLESKEAINRAAVDWLEVAEAGPYWLRLNWFVTEKLMKRATAALGKNWHIAEKVLRLYRVDRDDAGPHSREHYRDYTVPENASNWFLEIDGQSPSWKVELGYLVPDGKFFSLLHSADLQVDTNHRHQFSQQSPTHISDFSLLKTGKGGQLTLSVEGDVSLTGKTIPGAAISVDDDVVNVHHKSGHFHWRTPIQNGRVVIPIVAEFANQRMRAIISIESNIHYLEPEKSNLDS